MKVVLFCGGLGMRLRDASGGGLPKPLVPIGNRPILWHVMRYYAHFGHTEFILCLGHGGDAIREYVRDDPELGAWRITLAETGERSSIGERLAQSQRYVRDDEIFLANYTDGLTDLHLPDLVNAVTASDKVGAFLCIKPSLSYHFVRTGEDGTVIEIEEAQHIELRVNGGYFVFRRAIFDSLRPGEDLVGESFRRLVTSGSLLGYHYDGFWKNMDTFKDKDALDDRYAGGAAPWMVWRADARAGGD